jgi:hypothetical protein
LRSTLLIAVLLAAPLKSFAGALHHLLNSNTHGVYVESTGCECRGAPLCRWIPLDLCLGLAQLTDASNSDIDIAFISPQGDAKVVA